MENNDHSKIASGDGAAASNGDLVWLRCSGNENSRYYVAEVVMYCWIPLPEEIKSKVRYFISYNEAALV